MARKKDNNTLNSRVRGSSHLVGSKTAQDHLLLEHPKLVPFAGQIVGMRIEVVVVFLPLGNRGRKLVQIPMNLV